MLGVLKKNSCIKKIFVAKLMSFAVISRNISFTTLICTNLRF
jgi:hypothetical protein